MRVIYDDLKNKSLENRFFKIPAVITVGVFDGFHLGHQWLLQRVKFYAKKEKLFSVVFTFDIPPKLFLNKAKGYITDAKDKINFLAAFGIDYIWLFKTTDSLLKLSSTEFLSYIMKYFSIKIFVIGEDFKFAHKAKCSIKHLKKFSNEHGFKLIIIKKKIKNQKVISSSLIRKLISMGDLSSVVKFLGRNYMIKGRVYRDQGVGRKIGYPTANINTYNYVIPKKGVYAAWLVFGKKLYLCGVNIGNRPTINFSPNITVEAHIINFKKNIVNKEIKIIFLERIRNEKKFINTVELKKAIQNDIDYILKKYSNYPPNIVSFK